MNYSQKHVVLSTYLGYMTEQINLSGVPETMLQTIYTRAKERYGLGAIHDHKAEELVGRLLNGLPAARDISNMIIVLERV